MNILEDDTLNEILDREIVRELIHSADPLLETVSDELVDRIWGLCDSNPWNAGILYTMLNITKKEKQ